MDIWQAIVDGGVVLRPGFVFQTRTDEERDAEGDTAGYLRMSYASATVSCTRNHLITIGRGPIRVGSLTRP